MATLNEDLEMARLETRAKFPALEVVVQDGSVYINFAFSEAVILEPEITEHGRVWHAEALAWDRTHGVSAERYIASDPYLHAVLEIVDDFLRAQAEREKELQAIIDQMPEDF